MIRNFICITLAMFVLFTNSGLALTLHYCKEKIESVRLDFGSEIQSEKPEKNCCKSADSHKKCCDEKSVKSTETDSKFIVKTTDWQSAGIIHDTISYAFTPFVISSENKKSSPAFYSESHAPPRYLLYCSLVFYA